MRFSATLLTASVLLLVGCAGHASDAPETAPRFDSGPIEPKSTQVVVAEDAELPELARDSVARQAKELTSRVRNVGCTGIATGSGFALTRHVLITNRHVLAGADLLDISTWDGRTLSVSAAEVGRLRDIGFALVQGRLPRVAEIGRSPKAGDVITAVGYPLGGPLTLSHGVVIDRVNEPRLGIAGTVVRITATIRPGNSGGPLLDKNGRVVGIVYAIETKTRLGLAIPIDTMRRLIRVGGFEDVPPCGSQ